MSIVEEPRDSLELRQEHLECIEEGDNLVTTAKSESRDLTSEELDTMRQLQTKIARLRLEIEKIDCRNMAIQPGQKYEYDFQEGTASVSGDGGMALGTRYKTSDGRELRAYRHNEPMVDQYRFEREHGSLGDHLLAMLIGETRDAQSIGSVTTGGYMLNTQVSNRVWDLARAAMVTSAAGVESLPISGATRIARVSQDPTSVWRGELETIQASNMTFDAIELKPKTLACLIPVSIELLEDASGIAQQIENIVGASIGQALDLAVLSGSGASNEPLGVRNNPDCNQQTSVGTPTNYDDITSAVGTILTANYNGDVGRLSWISHPRDGTTYQGLVTGISSDNTPLQAPEWASQLRQFSTTALSITEGGGAESSMLIGDFSQVILGMRTNITLQILDQGTGTDADSTTWNATSQMLRWIRCYLRADVAVMRPTWMNVLSGVTNT